jgi:biotin carboxylase
VEQFIDGVELTVEGFKAHDRCLTLAISHKTQLPNNAVIAVELFYAPSHSALDYDFLRKTNRTLIEQMALPFGITHAEFRYDNGKYYLIEIAARGGGTKISSHIIPLISGVDANALLIRAALGERLAADNIVVGRNGIYATLRFFLLPSGTVKSIQGVESIRMLPGVVDLGLNFQVGDTISAPHDDRSRAGYFIACEQSEIRLRRLIEQVTQLLQVEYEARSDF